MPAVRVGSLARPGMVQGSRKFVESEVRSSGWTQAESTRSAKSMLIGHRADCTDSLRCSVRVVENRAKPSRSLRQDCEPALARSCRVRRFALEGARTQERSGPIRAHGEPGLASLPVSALRGDRVRCVIAQS